MTKRAVVIPKTPAGSAVFEGLSDVPGVYLGWPDIGLGEGDWVLFVAPEWSAHLLTGREDFDILLTTETLCLRSGAFLHTARSLRSCAWRTHYDPTFRFDSNKTCRALVRSWLVDPVATFEATRPG